MALNFDVASLGSFRDFPKISFCDGEVGGGSGGVITNFSRPETADDVIFGQDVETFSITVVGFSCF